MTDMQTRRPTKVKRAGTHRRSVEFDVLLEQDEDGVWAASVPALPGCFSQGETRKLALEHIGEAILLHRERVKPLPLQAVQLQKVRVEG
jgi:predicted RNase H-like HicB family nuclease